MLTRLTIILLLLTTCNRAGTIKSSKVDSSFYSSGELKYIKKYNSTNRWSTLTYFKNGKMSSKADYYNGKMVGTAIFFYPNGSRNFEQNFDSIGRSDGMFYLWYKNGKLKQIGENKNGKMIGEWKNYFANGKLMSIENHNEGKKNGIWIYFNNQGDTIKVEKYRGDSLMISHPN